jgi:BASS family bile acid:Na+ symporter
VPQSVVGFVNTVFVPAGLILIMFSMGLTLRLADFGQVLTNGRAVAGGLFGQLVLMPLLALAIGVIFHLPPELALALFILGICPAGTTSNALTFVGGGNVALAVVLTALSSLVTVFSIPLLLEWALPHFLPGGQAPHLSVMATIIQLARITLLPIAVGMIGRHLWPEVAARVVLWLKPTSLVILIGVIGISLIISFGMVMQNFLRAAPASWALNIAAMATGLGIARLLRLGDRDSMTLAIEVGVHNATLAIFLTISVLNSLPLAVTQNIYGILMVIDAGLLIRWYRRRWRAAGASTAN